MLKEKHIAGLICNTITYSTLKQYLNKDIGVALTGGETLPFPIIILKGFTNESIPTHDNIFEQNIYKYALMKPQTQIRAGATRPSVFIMPKK